MMSGESIAAGLKNRHSVHFLERTDSTNNVAKSLAEAGAEHGTAVVALMQTEGRGRTGKSFFSPDGGIYLSLVLRPDNAAGITPAAAVAICMVLERVCGLKPHIKWVNDILLEGKKVCGILTESRLPSYVILGVGLNYSVPQGGFPDSISDIAGALYSGEGIDKGLLIAALIDGLLNMDTENYIEQYRARCKMVGQAIDIITQGEAQGARALEITDDCGLRVQLDGGEIKVLTSGEVSTRVKTAE